jgi:hypothetical protein
MYLSADAGRLVSGLTMQTRVNARAAKATRPAVYAWWTEKICSRQGRPCQPSPGRP